MDNNKTIKKYGEDILSYRLRSSRSRKRAIKVEFEKHLLRLDREETELYRRRYNLGWIELRPPVQKGWKRFYVLREDVAASKKADFFEGILKKINTYEWSHRKDFRIRGRAKGRKYLFVKPQKLLEPMDYSFERMEFTEKERSFFDPQHRMEKNSGRTYVEYVFREPWRFVLRVRPNMIDKMRIRDADLDSQIQILRDYIERRNYRGKQNKLLRGRTRRHRVNPEHWYGWNAIKGKPVNLILNLIENGRI